MAAPTTNLPSILYVTGKSDAGEYGGATCPHCGALGRYVWTFRCADGTTRGAMAGCIKLFPRGPLADEHMRIVDRLKDRTANGQKLASWDVAKLDAIEDAADGIISEAEAVAIVRRENARRAAWMERRGRR